VVQITPAERRVYELVCQEGVTCKPISHLVSEDIPGLIRKALVEFLQ
jgi:hypothetical protein